MTPEVGGVDVVIVGAGAQSVQLGLDVFNIGLHAAHVLGGGLQGRVIQLFQLALVLLHHGLDLRFAVAGGAVGRRVKGVLRHLALVVLILVIVCLVGGVRFAEIVGVVLDGLDQLIVLGQLGLVDGELVFQLGLLDVQVGALDVGDQVALLDIAALRNGQLGDLARIRRHDIGLVGGLHRALQLADINARGDGAPGHKADHQGGHDEQKGIPVGGQLFFHHDAAVLQVVEVGDMHVGHGFIPSP